jgi:hypothetical protein
MHTVVRAGAESRGIDVEAAAKDSPGVLKLPFEQVGVDIIEPHHLQMAKSDQISGIKDLGFDEWSGVSTGVN